MPRERRNRRIQQSPHNDDNQPIRPFTRRTKIYIAAGFCIGVLELRGIMNARIEHERLRSSLDLNLETQEYAVLGEAQREILVSKLDEVHKELFGVPAGEDVSKKREELHDEEGKEVLVRGGIQLLDSAANVSSLPHNDLARIPSSLQYLGDLSVPFDILSDTPLFWHVPKAGGTSIKHMYSECYFGLVEACESGVTEGHENDISLQIVKMENGWRFLNVDLSTETGIRKAQAWNLTSSRKADIVISPLLHHATSLLFSHSQKARLFFVMRHPLERVVSLFYYLQNATHEPTYNPLFQHMTLQEYANSSWVESNFMVRSLINKMEGRLYPEDFGIAVAIMRKALIGLLENIHESTRRFDKFFGFQGDSACKKAFLKVGANRGMYRDAFALLSPMTFTFQELAKKNYMDMRLYKEAKKLFEEQGTMFTQAVSQ